MRAGPLMRIAVTKQPIHITDLSIQHPSFKRDDADSAAFSALAGVRTVVVVPMLKEQELVGTISVYRREVLRSVKNRLGWFKLLPAGRYRYRKRAVAERTAPAHGRSFGGA